LPLDGDFDACSSQLKVVDVGVSEEKEDPQPGTSAGKDSNWGASERKVQGCPFIVAVLVFFLKSFLTRTFHYRIAILHAKSFPFKLW
jgi:hypothetical protein